jgi:uncharacterized protein (TIGR02270 family)
VRTVGVNAVCALGSDAEGRIPSLLADPGTARAAALAAGTLNLDCAAELERLLGSDDMPTRFAAAWSLVLRQRHPVAFDILKGYADARADFRGRAQDLLLRCLPRDEAAAMLNGLAADPERREDAISGIASYGDPAGFPWLLERMRELRWARRAGAALSMITGWKLEEDGLSGPQPADGSGYGPNDDPADPNVTPTDDEGLPWPNAEAIAQRLAHAGFTPGARHLMGKPIDAAWCAVVQHEGRQPQRQAARTELMATSAAVPAVTSGS